MKKVWIVDHGGVSLMIKKTSAIGMLAAVFLFVNCVSADIYRYIDSQGVIHFTNVPTSARYKVYIKERPKGVEKTVSSSRYDRHISEASRTYGLAPALIKAIIKAESDFDPGAVSQKGALGLMQIMPENLRSLNINDPFNPRENIMGGALYFKEILIRYDKKVQLALAAYNAGPSRVDQYRSIPPFPETMAYVKKVMSYYYIFKKG